MKKIKLHSKGFFKHERIWHLTPEIRIVVEEIQDFYCISFEATFWHWSAYYTIRLNINPLATQHINQLTYYHIKLFFLFIYLKLNIMLLSIYISIRSAIARFNARNYAYSDGRPYKVFRFGTHYEILNASEIDARTLSQKRYVKKYLKHKFAVGSTILDFDEYCIYTAYPKRLPIKLINSKKQ